MKNLCLLIVFSVLCSKLFAQTNPAKKAIVIIVDGIPADMIERVNTPNIDAVSKVGGYTRATMGGEKGGYSQTPTISAVCYTSMITGTWGNKHNVWNNDLEDPNYNYWTMFRFLKNHQPDKKIGIYSTWLDNRTKLVGEGLPQTNNLKFDVHFDGYEIDTVRFPHDKLTTYISKIDEEVVKEATGNLREFAPDFSWVYLQYTDNTGHIYGDGEGMIDAIEKADRQVGELFSAIKFREQYFNEDWMFVVITDHGRDVATGKNHGGQTDRERTIWISTNKKDLNQQFYAHTPEIVDILPSIARHLDVKIEKEQLYELDGVPFVGEVSIAHPKAKIEGDKLQVSWTSFANDGKVKISVSPTNHFNKSGVEKKDEYVYLTEFNQADGKGEITLPKELKNSKFLKVILEGQHNILNRWIIR